MKTGLWFTGSRVQHSLHFMYCVFGMRRLSITDEAVSNFQERPARSKRCYTLNCDFIASGKVKPGEVYKRREPCNTLISDLLAVAEVKTGELHKRRERCDSRVGDIPAAIEVEALQVRAHANKSNQSRVCQPPSLLRPSEADMLVKKRIPRNITPLTRHTHRAMDIREREAREALSCQPSPTMPSLWPTDSGGSQSGRFSFAVSSMRVRRKEAGPF